MVSPKSTSPNNSNPAFYYQRTSSSMLVSYSIELDVENFPAPQPPGTSPLAVRLAAAFACGTE